MPRYEFKDAKSSKFWDIEKIDDGYRVIYGKIGTDGREQEKTFDTTEAADKAYDKAVASKLKKGYVLAGAEPDEAEEEEEENADGRPKGVPPGAVLHSNGYEWELAEVDDQGRKHGVTTWWRLDGTRCCRTEYVHGKAHGAFQRFHENGQVSREGTFDNGEVVGIEKWHRSSAKTTEHFAVYSAGRRVWTAEYDRAKGVRRFRDKNGELCTQEGKKLKAVESKPVAAGFSHWEAPPISVGAQEWEAPTFETELRNGVYFTGDLRGIIFPRRGGVETAVRPVPSVDIAWAALRRALWACDTAILTHERSKSDTPRSTIWTSATSSVALDRAYGERILSVEDRDATRDEDIALARRLFLRYRGVSVHGVYSVATYERATDYFVAKHGLGEAAAILMLGVDSELPYQRMGPFERLRDLLAVAPQAEFDAAKKRILQGHEEAVAKAHEKSYVGRLPAHLSWVASFLLPLGAEGADAAERECADRALKACVGAGFGNDELNAGGLASVDVAGLERFIETNPKIRHEFFIGGSRIYLASILDSEGIAAAPTLARMKLASPFADSAAENNRWAFILAHLDSDEALGALYDEHVAGYDWGAEGLALARAIQPERTKALLSARGAADLWEKLEDTAPLGPPRRDQGDADADGAPTAFEPDAAKRAPARTTRIATPLVIEWEDEEREEALDRGVSAIEWNDKPITKLDEDELEAWMAHRERWAIPSEVGAFALRNRAFDARLSALGYEHSTYDARFGLGLVMSIAGEGAMGLLASMLHDSLENTVQWAMPFAHPSLAPPILLGFTGKKYKAECRAWMLRHPRCAWASAIDMAFLKKKKLSKEEKGEKKAGERALRYLAGQGHREAMVEDAESIGAADELRELLDVDPLTLPKAKIPKLPKFAAAGSLPALEKNDGGELSTGEVEALLVRLAVSNVDEVHPAVTEARAALTDASKAAFSWALFEAWLSEKADPKQGWAMQAVGFFGDDESARKLCALAKDWPGQKASARAQAALDALLSIGTESALVNMNLLAEKSKYPAFKAAAAERIGLIARARGLTRDQLQDRLVPTLSLDEEGSSRLDYGARSFDVSFNEQLRPVVRDESGKVLKSLPKPAKTDDAALAKAAKARLSALKKDAKASATVQLSRLERAMTSQRAIESAVFATHFVAHPWLSHLTKRLVWGVLDESGNIAQTFRVAEDGTFADAEDEEVTLPEDSPVCIVHPLSMDEAKRAKWSQVFGDYAILQPFEQLARETFAPEAEEATSMETKRFDGTRIAYGALRALTKKGWQPWADSWITAYSKKTPGGAEVQLTFEPGYSPAGDEFEEQTVEALSLQGGAKFGDLDALAFSEVVRDLTKAAGA